MNKEENTRTPNGDSNQACKVEIVSGDEVIKNIKNPVTFDVTIISTDKNVFKTNDGVELKGNARLVKGKEQEEERNTER